MEDNCLERPDKGDQGMRAITKGHMGVVTESCHLTYSSLGNYICAANWDSGFKAHKGGFLYEGKANFWSATRKHSKKIKQKAQTRSLSHTSNGWEQSSNRTVYISFLFQIKEVTWGVLVQSSP